MRPLCRIVNSAMRIRISPKLLLVWVLAISGCSSKPLVSEYRSFPAGVETGDAVAFLLLNYSGSERERVSEEGRVAIEQTLFSCVSREIANENLGLILVAPKAFRQTAFSGENAGQLPGSPEEILKHLADSETISDHTIPRLRYVVLLEAFVMESDSELLAASGTYAFALGAEWTRSVTQQATVLDIVHRRVAGRLSTSSEGDRAIGVVVVVPFVFWTNPDRKACSELGRGLARFLNE